jgi:hypothetical protein
MARGLHIRDRRGAEARARTRVQLETQRQRPTHALIKLHLTGASSSPLAFRRPNRVCWPPARYR